MRLLPARPSRAIHSSPHCGEGIIGWDIDLNSNLRALIRLMEQIRVFIADGTFDSVPGLLVQWANNAKKTKSSIEEKTQPPFFNASSIGITHELAEFIPFHPLRNANYSNGKIIQRFDDTNNSHFQLQTRRLLLS
jgi:hypothetical protein